MLRLRMFATPAWLLGMSGVLWVLHWSGNGVLALPALDHHEIVSWLHQTNFIVIVLALLRVIALSVTAYLLMCVTLAVLAEGMGSRSLAHLVKCVSIPVV